MSSNSEDYNNGSLTPVQRIHFGDSLRKYKKYSYHGFSDSDEKEESPDFARGSETPPASSLTVTPGTEGSGKSAPRGRSRMLDKLSSEERKHYNKALKELYEIVRIGTRRIEISNPEDTDVISTESDVTIKDLLPSSDPSTITLRSDYKVYSDSVESSDENSRIQFRRAFSELKHISKKLQKENQLLSEREAKLREREDRFNETTKMNFATDSVIQDYLDSEVQKRCAEMEQLHNDEIQELHKLLSDKNKEIKRLRSSFDVLKKGNDNLRKQMTELQEQNKKTESQSLSLQSRLTNLQKRNELILRQKQFDVKLDKPLAEKNTERNKENDGGKHNVSFVSSSKVNLSGTFEVLAQLLEWVSDSQLQHPLRQSDSDRDQLTAEIIHDKCVRVLPALSEILCFLPTVNSRVQFPCLQFIYWSMIYLDKASQATQRKTLSSTYRRIGEELYKPQLMKLTDSGQVVSSSKAEKQKADVYFHNPNLDVRFLSTLIILKTLTQVDHLAHVFDVLKADLREELAKQMFITYDGIDVILPFIRVSQKQMLVGSAVDVMLQMSVESVHLQPFLEKCSTEIWFRTCVMLLQATPMDQKLAERLSIILQRLSKIKTNRRYFEAFQVAPLLQEMLRDCEHNNPFLALNLRSILYNIGYMNK